MPSTKSFDYEIVDAAGKRAKGKIEAVSEGAAAQALRLQGGVPVAISPTGSMLRRDLSLSALSGRTSIRDLAVFARQFATMSASGMSLLRCLAVLEDQAPKPSLRKALTEVRSDVEQGISLSGSLAKHDKVFPTLMVALVRSGEAGGFLDEALERIAVTFEKDAQLRGKIKSALTYPVIVLAFSGLLIAGVLIFIVPVFERMFKQFGGNLPLPTQVLVTTSHSMWWSGPIVLGLLIGGTALMRHLLRTRPPVRLRVDRLKLRMPVFGSLFTKIAVSRFARNLGSLLNAGVPVLQALDVVGATTGNAVITDAMRELQIAVREGRPMSTAVDKQKVFPRMVAQMVEVGEESGQLSQMLDKIADFYDREVDSAADALTSSIEPIMVLLMGVVVGTMVVCLYLPMFTVYQHIQGAQ